MTCKEQIYTYDVNEISNSDSDYSITPYIVWNFILRLSQGTLFYKVHFIIICIKLMILAPHFHQFVC